MDKLRVKIEKTILFSEAAKVRLLAHLEELPPHEQNKLESTIDEFESKVRELGNKLRNNINEQIDSLKEEASTDEKQQVEEASEVVKTGVDVLIGAPPQSS